MKIVIALNRATAGSVYSEPDMGTVAQLLPSDEELAERETAKAEKERKDAAENAKKKATAEKEKAAKGPEDKIGDTPKDEQEDDSEEGDEDEEEGDEEAEATAATFTDATVNDTAMLEIQNQKKPEDMNPEELEKHLDKQKADAEAEETKTDADGNPIAQPKAATPSELASNEIKPAAGAVEKPKTKPLSPALAAALEALDDNLRPTSFL